MFGYIYRTHNKINGRMYVGQKKSPVFLGERYLGSGSVLGQAIEKYGKENFYVELLEEVEGDHCDLDEREEFWGNKLNVVESDEYYNVCRCGCHGPGGTPTTGMYGKKHSEKTKRIMSENRLGEKNANYGNRWNRTPDMKYGTIEGEKNPMHGKHHSESTIEILSEKAKNLAWVCNEKEVLRIRKDKLNDYLSNGYQRGRKFKYSSTTIESITNEKYISE